MNSPASFLDALPDDAVWRLEEVCCRFEDAWRSGQRPCIEDALGTTAGSERTAVLYELLRLEVYYRRVAAEDPRRDEYGARFPEAIEVLDELFAPGRGAEQTADLSTAPAARASLLTTDGGDSDGSVGADGWAGEPARYRRLRFHAAGNLGEVHIARDEELDREVALKEIQTRHAHHPDRRLRFLLEGSVTGRLEHPGIVPVYGMGTYPDGRPYYAMRFIRGETLGSAIARFHAGKAGRFDALEFRQLLGRFLAVCQAVGYAHSRGVLHRDLKPENIMLGSYGETLVVDWGLAKCLGRPDDPEPGADAPALGSGTEAGAVMGTPAFMSPEQAAGEVDTLGPAADVYALGATLYVLLVGRPSVSGSLKEVLARVRAGDWPPPSQVTPGVPRALEGICLKAMALVPDRRYPSAVALGEDVEHWLADEPVAAYREPPVARMRRWVRKHPRSVTAVGVAMLAAVVGLTVVAGLVEQNRQNTQEQFRITRKAARKFLVSVNEEELLHEPGMHVLRHNLLVEALDYYKDFLERRPGDLEVLQEQAEANRQLGELYAEERGRLEVGRALIDRSVTSFEDLRARGPDSRELRRGLAQAYLARSAANARGQDPGAELVAVDRSVELLSALSAESPESPDILRLLGRGYRARASALARVGQLDRALDDNTRAGTAYWTAMFISIQEYPGLVYLPVRHEANEPRGHFLTGYQVMSAWLEQGELQDQAGRKGEAAVSFATAARSARWLQSHYTFVQAYHPRRTRIRIGLAAALLGSGRIHMELGRPAAARAALEEAVELARGFLVDTPPAEAARYEEILAEAHGCLGECLLQCGQTGRAAVLLDDSVARGEAVLANGAGEHVFLKRHARVRIARALLAEASGRWSGAESDITFARTALDRAGASAPWDTGLAGDRLDTRELLIRVRVQAGKIGPDEWVREQRQILNERTDLIRRLPAAARSRANLGATAAALAWRLAENGRPAEAVAVVEAVIPDLEREVRENGLAHRLGARSPAAPGSDLGARERVSRLDPDGYPRHFGARFPAHEPEDFATQRVLAELLAAKGAALAAEGRRDAATELVRRAADIADRLARGGTCLPGPLDPLQPGWAALALSAARREPAYLHDLSRHLAQTSTLPASAGDDSSRRAIGALRDFLAAGFDARAALAADPRLVPLRHRDDFQQLLRAAGP